MSSGGMRSVSPTFEPLGDLDRRINCKGTPGSGSPNWAGRWASPPAGDRAPAPAPDGGGLSFHAEVDPGALGFTICALVRLSPLTRDLHVIPDIGREVREVTECYRIPARTATS